MPDEEFKLRIVKMLAGLERRVEDFSKSSNKESKYKKEPLKVEESNK